MPKRWGLVACLDGLSSSVKGRRTTRYATVHNMRIHHERRNQTARKGANHHSTKSKANGHDGTAEKQPPKPPYRFAGDLPSSLGPLRDSRQWLVWDYVWNDRKEKWDKPPRSAHTGRLASINNPDDLGTFPEAVATAARQELAGVGFLLTPGDDWTGIDLDDCITDSGSYSPLAAEIIDYAETYAEVSPSGKGVRLFALGKVDKPLKHDASGIEVYGTGRYLTITGRQIEGTPSEIRPAPRTLARLKAIVKAAQEARRAKPNSKAQTGSNFWGNVNAAALTNLDRWVPALHPTARKQATGAWRVPSEDLGRDLEEDLSYHPDGIRDYGEEYGLTPIDAVQKYGDASDATVAAMWLCQKLGIEPTSLGWRADNDAAAIDSDLIKMNADYAVVKVGGKTRVVSMEDNFTYPGCKVPVYSTFADFCAFHASPKKVVVGDDGKVRKLGIGRRWINHEKRRQYNGIVYAPGADAKATRGKLNLWTGFGCVSRKGDCSLYLAHLRDNVCSGVKDHFEYLLNWMAYAAQYPGHQGEVAVVMRGNEGAGKGVAAGEFGRLFGSHYRHISQASHLTGHFNAHLQQCSVLFADEAFFAGDRSHESILKAIITEATLMIEPKGLDSYPVRNCLHIIMSSNSDWVVPAGADARRYFVVTVGDDHKQDHPYFAAIVKQMENGGREALLHHLLNRDLTNFNVRNVPQTDALADQKAHSRRGVDRLVEILAHEGVLPAAAAHGLDIAVTTGEGKGEGFYPQAKTLVPDLKFSSSVVIAKALKSWGCKPWRAHGVRGIQFPPLKELRVDFDRKHGKQTWPDGGQEWGDQ